MSASFFKRLKLTFELKLLLVVFILLAIPFIALSFYAVPNLEDYAESIIPSVWWHVKFLYLSYDGRFFTSFLFAAFNPLKFESYLLYQCIPIAIMLGLFYAFYQLFINFVTSSRKYALAYSSLLFVLFLSGNPNIPYTFYYMISSYVYTVPGIFFLLFLSFSFQVLTAKAQRILPLVLSVLSIFCFAGGNELLLIPGVVYLLSLFILNNKFKYAKHKELLVLVLAMSCAYFIVFTSPGTKDFLIKHPEDRGLSFIFKALQKSIYISASVVPTWFKAKLSLFFILPSLIYLMLRDQGVKKVQLGKKAIIVLFSLVTLGLFLLIFPYTWAAYNEANAGYTQVFIIPYLFFTIYIAGIAFFFVSKSKFQAIAISKPLFAGLMLGLLASSLLSNKSSIKTAYKDLLSKEAFLYHQEVMENIQVSKNSENHLNEDKEVEICTLKHQPKSLYSGVYFTTQNEGFHLQYRLFYDIKKLKVVECR